METPQTPDEKTIKQKDIYINVKKATNLKIAGTISTNQRRMLPFFSYDFYTFEVRSPTISGTSPEYNHTKHFQVEDNH